MFSAKELKNDVIYTYTSVSIENVCTRGEGGLPTRWGHPGDATGQTGCVPFSLQGVKLQPTRLKTHEKSGWSGEELLLSLQPRLPAQTHCRDVGQGGRKEGRAPNHGLQEQQNQVGEDGYLHNTDCMR